MKNRIKYLLVVVFAFVLVAGQAQMSVFNKVDTFKGVSTNVIPSGESVIVFSTPQDLTDTVRFRMTKFDECRDLDWVRDYVIKDVPGVSGLDAITIGDDIYLLLKSPFYRLVLVKMDKGGIVEWAKTFHSKEGDDVYSVYSNILVNKNNDVLYVVSGYKGENTVIFAMNMEGEIMYSKIINKFKHKSSVINGLGDLVMFSEKNSYVGLDLDDEIIDTVLWSKNLSGNFVFDELNDPIAVSGLGDTSVITAVVDTFSKPDTAIYRLVKFDKKGEIAKETKGFYADSARFYSGNSLKFMRGDKAYPKPIYYMVNNKVFFFNDNLVQGLDPKIYKFNDRDNYRVYTTSLEICDDQSLVMSGFCYENKDNGEINNESPYMFISKTQPAEKQFVVEAETENCLVDSSSNEMIEVSKLVVNNDTFPMDTIEIIVGEVKSGFKPVDGFNEEKCGKINLDEKTEEKEFCPGKSYPLNAPSLGCGALNYKWSTGVEGQGLSRIDVAKEGEYYVTVTYCDTVKISKFVYKYTDANECFKVYYPNAFFPSSNRDTINSIFNMVIDTNYGKDEYEFVNYEMKIFDRWGEKVFETTDPDEGWDGKFRGEEMPPEVYLYSIDWKVNVQDVKDYSGNKKGQIMLLR